MEIPKSLQPAWNDAKKAGKINRSEFNNLVKTASHDKKSENFSSDETTSLGQSKNELDKKGLTNQNSISVDKINISSFKTSTAQNKIKISNDIKVPEQIKEIWDEVTKDGILTTDDYQKVVKSSMTISNTNFIESYDFIKTMGDKLQANKGVVFFVDHQEEVSLNELNELLDLNGKGQGYEHNFDIQVAEKFKGAYYRKVESDSSVDNKGINGVGTLPTVEFDSKRFFVDPKKPDSYKTGPLDRPSVYFGGRAGNKEMDVGLTWDRVYDRDGLPTFTDKKEGTDGRSAAHRFTKTQKNGVDVIINDFKKVVASGKEEVDKFAKKLKPNFGFRPFWRTTNNNSNQWNQVPVGNPGNMYFYPGEKINMSVKETGKNKVKLDISLEQGKINQHFEKTFGQEQFGVGNEQSFKRVNSIDQFKVNKKGQREGLEGEDVLPSNTKAKGGGWSESSVIDSKGNKKPMTGNEFKEVRGGDTAKNYDKLFKRYNTNPQGGEMIDITPFKP